MQKRISISMSQPCSETTPTLYHAYDVVQEREGNEMVVDAQTPALLLPLHRLAADDEDQGGRGEQEGLLVSGEGEHQHHQHRHIIISIVIIICISIHSSHNTTREDEFE